MDVREQIPQKSIYQLGIWLFGLRKWHFRILNFKKKTIFLKKIILYKVNREGGGREKEEAGDFFRVVSWSL
jgi:hypothetical protein